jgi:hypothetical protein
LGQTKRTESPSAPIKFLTYQTARPHKDEFLQVVTVSCGLEIAQEQPDREAARSLVAWGVSAIPDIEAALDSIAKHGEHSKFARNSGWLLYAYAKIRGPAAYPQLRKLQSHGHLDLFGNGLDTAIALSLGLTSYVEPKRRPAHEGCHGAEPREALDQMILSWERGDHAEFEGHLGPNAKAALTRLPGRKLLEAKPGAGGAVGFRLDISGRWSGPEETLDEDGYSDHIPNVHPSLMNPELATVFTNRLGHECGRTDVRFFGSNTRISLGGPPVLPEMYLVDNSDIDGLLHLISTCAAQK